VKSHLGNGLLGEPLSKLEKRVRSLARDDRRVRRLMSAPVSVPSLPLSSAMRN